MSKAVTTKQDEGGYYAIKGFLYQFDKTLIEVLNKPHKTIGFERRQDIDYEDFVLQVKHKETQHYTPGKVRKAVEGLMEVFSKGETKQLCLYCHFKDKQAQDCRLTLAELDNMLSANAKTRYPESFRRQFLDNFIIRFSEDYETQFKQTLHLIKSSFSLPDIETAAIYHSIFRSKLLDRSIRPRSGRTVRYIDLRSFLEDADVRVFERAYAKYVGAEKYARLIRKLYFTLSAPNIEKFERLFLVECDSTVSHLDLIKLATRVSRKFYRKGKSPQPYLIFRQLTDGALKKLKQGLFDSGIHFFDGTHFDGDRFRLDELAGGPANGSACALKVVSEHQAIRLVQAVEMQEVFQFFVRAPIPLNISGGHRRIQVETTKQILQMIT